MRRLPSVLMLTLLTPSTIPSAVAQWEIRATGDATVEITRQQAPVVTAGYNFWAANWQYAGTRLKLGGPKAGGTGFSGTVSRLDLTIDGTIASPAANQLRYTWNIHSATDLDGIIGGGLEFQLASDSPALNNEAGEPVLLDNHRGWKWPVAPGRAILVEFDPPIANVYFEQGNKDRIRAMLIGDTFPKGTGSVTMTITLPEGGKVAKSLAERYGPVDTTGWYADALRFDASPVDLSFLNHKPAGKHGFVRASSDEFRFEDGTPVRFWGGNIAAYAIFSDKEQIRTQAQRIARLGYNLMRIHHHDSTRWVGRTVIDKNRQDSQHFDAEVMDRLDWDRRTEVDAGVKVVTELDRDFIPAGQHFVRSDTGQLVRNWVKGYQVIDTQLTQAAHGWIGGETVKLHGVTFQIDTPKAAVAVTGLDEKPIGQSKRMLITAIARAVPSADGRMPMLSEPVVGQLNVLAPAGLKLVPLGGDGEHLEAVSAVYENQRYRVTLPAPRGTHWFLLTESK